MQTHTQILAEIVFPSKEAEGFDMDMEEVEGSEEDQPVASSSGPSSSSPKNYASSSFLEGTSLPRPPTSPLPPCPYPALQRPCLRPPPNHLNTSPLQVPRTRGMMVTNLPQARRRSLPTHDGVEIKCSSRPPRVRQPASPSLGNLSVIERHKLTFVGILSL